ncbi:unnamed protein product [Cylindrotheca closterium]|uniref:Uncharacterized protein n=1 Tax=Cylindrotheca closterium TaxID=2856 RepID=A0AAD2JL73_9STRA|nr:unnamed protein product [Cylindrotheca closterium]
MLDYQQFLKASRETLSNVSVENFGSASFAEAPMNMLKSVVPEGCAPDTDFLKEVFSMNDPENVQQMSVEALKERLASFQAKGWLSQQESRQYKALLNTASGSQNSNALRTLEKQLDQIEEKMTGRSANKTGMGGLFPQTNRFVPTPGGAASSVASDASYSSNSMTQIDNIVSPRILSTVLSESQVADLFVETCFFARLGFIQPPCCMQCTYLEAMEGASPNTRCGRWVVWRKDATKVLHPKSLLANTMAIKCHTTRKLLAGQRVEGFEWDTKLKLLARRPRAAKHSF